MSIPPDLLAELEAAVALVQTHRPASVLLRLGCDRDGRLRLRAEGLDVPLRALAQQQEGGDASCPTPGLGCNHARP